MNVLCTVLLSMLPMLAFFGGAAWIKDHVRTDGPFVALLALGAVYAALWAMVMCFWAAAEMEPDFCPCGGRWKYDLRTVEKGASTRACPRCHREEVHVFTGRYTKPYLESYVGHVPAAAIYEWREVKR